MQEGERNRLTGSGLWKLTKQEKKEGGLMVTIKINGKDRFYEDGVQYELIAEQYQNECTSQIALVEINGKIQELMKRVTQEFDKA